MTAPDLASVIAATLAAHACEVVYYIGGAGHISCHGCDGNWASFHGFHEHQARAVLAAISEAGAVEWGVRWDHISEMYPERTDWAQSPEDAQAIIDKSFATGSVVTRIAAGPWLAAGG